MKGPSVKQSMKCQVCSKLADLLADLPPPIKHRSLEHHYTESVDMYYHILADQVADLTPSNRP